MSVGMEEQRQAKIQYVLEHYPHKLIVQCMGIFMSEQAKNDMEARMKRGIDRYKIRANEGHEIWAFTLFEIDALKKVLDAKVTLRKLVQGENGGSNAGV